MRAIPVLLLSACAATAQPGPTTPPAAPAPAADTKVQPTPLGEADLKFLRDLTETRNYRLGKPVSPRVLPDGSKVLFLRAQPRKPMMRLYSFDVKSGRVDELVTPEQILKGASEQLSPEEKARRERMRVSLGGFTHFDLSEDGQKVLLSLSGRVYVLTMASGKIREVAGPEGRSGPPFDAKLSPDGKLVSFVRGGELWVTPVEGGAPKQLTSGATDEVTHAQAEFVAQEEMSRFTGYWWSPDSQKLVYEVADASQVEKLWLGDPSNPMSPVRPSAYPRPGKNNVRVTLAIVPASGGRSTWIQWDREKYPYLTRVTWAQHAPLTIDVETRDQHDALLLSVDPKTGRTTEMVHEHDDVFLNVPNEYHWLRDGSAFLWSTERAGAWQLELHDREGKLMRPLTDPSLGFKGLRHVDPAAQKLIVAAGDPIATQLYAVPMGGGPAQALTHPPGSHDGSWARDSAVHVTFVRATDATEVHRADGSLAGVLPSVAETPALTPRLEVMKVGAPGYYAALVRPRNFDPRRKYPVIVYVYGGPTHNMVHDLPGAYLTEQWIADHGYIIAIVDNRGTPGRGRAWERAIFGKFADIPLEGQVEGLKALAQKEPAMDLGRVGIMGHSFGGYMAALAVLRRPDVFRAAVASAPVTDWLDYDTFYTERYLGVPDKDTSVYDRNGLVKYAADLSRALLIVHGTADDNVHFNQALKLADALFRAGKRFELLPLDGQTHMFYQPELTFRYWQRIFEFFRANLSN